MKWTLTGINPEDRPNLQRKIVTSDTSMAITVDIQFPNGKANRKPEINHTVRMQRHYDFYNLRFTRDYDLAPYPADYRMTYIISGGPGAGRIEISATDYQPHNLTTLVVLPDGAEIEGPTFTLDKQCLPIWRGLVAHVLTRTELDTVVKAAHRITSSSYLPYGLSLDDLVTKLTTTPA